MSALLGFPRFLAFSVGRALQGIRRNALMSLAAIATMVLMLLLLAGFWLLQAGLAAGVAYVEEKVEIVADLRDVAGAEAVLVVAGAGRSPPTSRPCRRSAPSATSRRTRRSPASGRVCGSADRSTSPDTWTGTRSRPASR